MLQVRSLGGSCLVCLSTIDSRLDLFRHQDHGTSGKLWVRPVHSCIKQFSKVTRHVTKRQQLVRDLVRRAPDYQSIAYMFQRDLLIWLIFVFLEQIDTAMFLELREKLFVLIEIHGLSGLVA